MHRFDRLWSQRAWRALIVCVACSAVSACASPNLYATARALRRGQVQHTVALEGVGAVYPEAAYLPSLPTYQLRVGVAERTDIGVRIANATSLGVDARVELVRGAVDVAVVPGLQGTYVPFSGGPPGLLYGHVPIVVALHPSDRATLVLTGGVTWGVTLGRAAVHSNTVSMPVARDATDSGVALRVGVALAARVHPRLRLFPEVTALVTPETGRTTLTTGFGFQWGALDESQ
ncbi:MAG: hypothetical protein JNK05_13045 [Myxococcales bacterium]|nr:hypothetical protein [Myxococcales bacterium]